jgi:cell division protein ZapA (FtsZ GTPase activity inhibitor)
MEDLIPINILIGDRTYRLKVEPHDEEAVRKSIKLINDKILEFKTNFSGKDMQDYIAMVLIWLATEKNKPNADWLKLQASTEQLQTLEDMLDKVLE